MGDTQADDLVKRLDSYPANKEDVHLLIIQSTEAIQSLQERVKVLELEIDNLKKGEECKTYRSKIC